MKCSCEVPPQIIATCLIACSGKSRSSEGKGIYEIYMYVYVCMYLGCVFWCNNINQLYLFGCVPSRAQPSRL